MPTTEVEVEFQAPAEVAGPSGEEPAESEAKRPGEQLCSATVRAELLGHLKSLMEGFSDVPAIYKRRKVDQPGVSQELGVQVPYWSELRRRREFDLLQAYSGGGGGGGLHSGFVPTQPPPSGGGPHAGPPSAAGAAPAQERAPRASAAAKSARTKAKGNSSGRTYTSKYRGVHQTFPTRRWEAQFRRCGKPTSLGCFDHEEEAARAYDKMMLWCELHNATGVKGGITNFDASEYEGDVAWLQQISQDELVQLLRSDGRRQAAQRMLKQKRDGAGAHQSGGTSARSDSD